MNYYAETEKIISSLQGKPKPTLLLHSCCAVCSAHVLSVLTDYFDVSVFYSNSNIYPKAEFEKREQVQRGFVSNLYGDTVKYICDDYNPKEFYEVSDGFYDEKEGGTRCDYCIKMRLTKTAKFAKNYNFEYFTTTLTVSPHKNAAVINTIGLELEKEHGINFLQADFKKKDGFKHSNTLAQQYGLYRQSYCGCVFGYFAQMQG